MAILAAFPLSLLLAAASPSAVPSPVPTSTPSPIQCLDASGNPIPEAANPAGPDGPATPPKLIKRVNPLGSRGTKCRLPTTAKVEALITSKGDVCGVVVIGEVAPGCEPFGEWLRDAVKQWKFEPARDADNRPVAVYFLTTTTFN